MKFFKHCIHAVMAFAVLGIVTAQPSLAATKSVTIGYQLNDNLWKYPIANGTFSKATGYDIHWKLFTSGSQVISAMASGDVQIAMAGSTPIAAAVSHQLPIQLFWILEGIGQSEEMVVRNGSGIAKPADFAGKRLATPQASTSDLDLHVALEHWGIPIDNVHLYDMQPNAIVAAWRQHNIDAAFIWPPALNEIKKTGKVFISSKDICDKWQVCTFNGLVVRKDWAAANPDFMVTLVRKIAENVADYQANTAKWTADSPMVKSIAQFMGVDAKGVPAELASYDYPSLADEISAKWLGGGAAHSILVSAKFLKKAGQISEVLPDYSAFVTDQWAKKAQQSQ